MKLKYLYTVLFACFLVACGPTITNQTTSDLMGNLPDLVVDSINVGMVDENGRCKEHVNTVNQRLADKGIEFDYVPVGHGANIEILNRPEGLPDMEIFPISVSTCSTTSLRIRIRNALRAQLD